MALTLPTDDRSKKLIVGAVVLVAIVGGYFWFFWRPAQVLINITAAHADTLDAMNAKTRILVENGSEVQLRADAARYNEELTVLRRLVPTKNEVPALINAIATAARQAGMDLSEFAPDGELPGDQFDAVKFKLAVTGPYHKVAEFLSSVGSLARIVTPINLEMFPSARTIDRKPGKNETFIDAKFGVLTYVAKTVVAPPATAAAKPGGN